MRRYELIRVTETLSQASLVYKSGIDQSLLGIREAGLERVKQNTSESPM